jgi:hypothetical protein
LCTLFGSPYRDKKVVVSFVRSCTGIRASTLSRYRAGTAAHLASTVTLSLSSVSYAETSTLGARRHAGSECTTIMPLGRSLRVRILVQSVLPLSPLGGSRTWAWALTPGPLGGTEHIQRAWAHFTYSPWVRAAPASNEEARCCYRRQDAQSVESASTPKKNCAHSLIRKAVSTLFIILFQVLQRSRVNAGCVN